MKQIITSVYFVKKGSRIRQALNTKLKSISTKEILGLDLETSRKWIEYQMTPEMNWSNIEVDHVKPICLFHVSQDEEQKKRSPGKTLSPY